MSEAVAGTGARALPPLVEEALSTGRVTYAGGPKEIHSNIPRPECELIYRMAELSQACVAIEVGMAFAISTACLCDALKQLERRNGPETRRVISIDPHQSLREGWNGRGRELIRLAGFESMHECIETASQTALPELLRRGERCQLAFIDGWGTFDHALVDFFYIDRMLDAGGVIIFNDAGWPSIYSVLRFVLCNRDYEAVDVVRDQANPSRSLRIRRAVKALFRPLARTDLDPSAESRKRIAAISNCSAVALRKIRDDKRGFDHFNSF